MTQSKVVSSTESLSPMRRPSSKTATLSIMLCYVYENTPRRTKGRVLDWNYHGFDSAVIPDCCCNLWHLEKLAKKNTLELEVRKVTAIMNVPQRRKV